jgi:putative ABC transport system permease protein
VGEALKEGGRGMTGGRSRLRSGLVVAEVALSLVLLVAAGLLSRSFRRLLDVRPGFDPEGVVALDVVPRSALYPKPEQRVQFFRGFLEQSERVPGVEAVGLVDPLPLGGNFEAWDFEIEGRPPAAPGEPRTADRRIVSPDYFRAMRVPLLRGRAFTRDDRADSTKVVVVNEALARQFFPGEDALGKRLVIGDRATGTREIVGVVGDVRHAGLDEKTTPELYIPFTQATPGRLTVVARSPDPGAAADALRAVIRQSDRESPIYNVRTMDQLLSTSVARRRFNMILLGGFAAVALLLAALGIYGVVSYTVAQRTHEIGLRVALGARPRDVLSLVIRQGMTPALAGVGVGLCAALAVTRVMAGLLFNVSATDPATFALIPLLLAAVALLACYVPARRASRVDPLVALRHE